MVTLHFASLFVVGSLLARNRIEVRDYYRSLSKRWRIGLSVIAVFLIIYGAGPPIVRAWIGDFSDWFIVMGLVWLLVLALSSETLTGILRSSIPQFLGRISYSLYLIHATVLFALVHLSFGHMPLLLLFPVYVGLSIGLAVIMHRYAEVPAIDLGRRLASDLRPQAKSLGTH
jgi:peptidoglycan/LPS O-acetylase OafA/YrhL